MKRLSKQSRTFFIGVLCFSIILLGLNTFLRENTESTTRLQGSQIGYSLIPLEPIKIISDSDFGDSKYNFPGSGTEENPYVIEYYNITTTEANCINIADTTKYFIIRNCYLDADFKGVCITNVAEGTAIITNNKCCNNHDSGIFLESSSSCVITYNQLQKNEGFGVFLGSDSEDNIIHHNNFIKNNLEGIFDTNSQAVDHGIANIWYDTTTHEGNFWDDYNGVGIYLIAGLAGANDPYPLNELLNLPVISEPTNSIEIQIFVLFYGLTIICASFTIRKRLKKDDRLFVVQS